jgi:hypothetical protein
MARDGRIRTDPIWGPRKRITMEPDATPPTAAKKQYTTIRQSLTDFQERVVDRYWNEDTVVHAGYERLLGSLDLFAGWLLHDEEISHRGQTLIRGTADDRPKPIAELPRGTAAETETETAEPQTQEPQTQEPQTQEPQTQEPQTETGQTGLVDVAFTLPADVQADRVALSGEFNQWSVDGIRLERDSDGTWRAVVPLEPGRSYRYRYLLDGERWENAREADSYLPNPFGSVDSVMVVGAPPES